MNRRKTLLHNIIIEDKTYDHNNNDILKWVKEI